MEKLEFRSEAEKEIFMQLISKKEAIRLCFEQKDSSYMESEVQKLDDMLDELEQHYSLAIYDLQDPSSTRTGMVEDKGQFSIRGGIIDIFSYTDEAPVRIELW